MAICFNYNLAGTWSEREEIHKRLCQSVKDPIYWKSERQSKKGHIVEHKNIRREYSQTLVFES